MSTLSDVARAAGVSLATASRALNGAPGRSVRPELRERVEQAARELDYQPHTAAQTMARGHSNSVGLIVNDITDPFFAAVAAGVTQAASRYGRIVTLSTTGVGARAKTEVVNLMAGQRVRSLVLAGGVPPGDPELGELQAALGKLMAAGARVSSIGGEVLAVDAIHLPNEAGAEALAEALLGLGHRRFAALGGPVDHPTTSARADAFVARIRAGGGELTARIDGGMDRAAGRAAAEQLLDELPDVIFASTDLLALGALRRLREAGVRVPDDVGLAGFGDSEALTDVVPAITSVFVDAQRAGELAAEQVLGPVDGVGELGYEVRLRASTQR